NRRAGDCTVGSNPTPSAITIKKYIKTVILYIFVFSYALTHSPIILEGYSSIMNGKEYFGNKTA
ncbi:hypothetical protein, partial [Bartonella apis]|uniref:hypothetical protein n=1 Tax=Bartonella apis TaxID=1686310 RepID=UPI0024318859